MDNVVLLITIGERSKSEEYLSFFKENDIPLSLGTYGKGTASKETLELLGIGNSEKCVIFSVMPLLKSSVILKELGTNMHMKRRGGYGISFTVPISSIDSKRSLQLLAGDVSKEEGEGYEVETESELIVVIANRGYTEQVMEVAREAGAPGGTVVHARGTGAESSEKFFGTMIGAEKEMIFIVAKTENRNAIMNAIRDRAGVTTESGAVVFSLPVNETAGIMGS